MATGMIAGVGQLTTGSTPVTQTLFTDYEISLQQQTEGVDNWQPLSSAGTNCYVYDYKPLQDYPTSGFTASSVCDLLPRSPMTQAKIEAFSWCNASETTTVNDAPVFRVFSFRGKPTDDIYCILRIWHNN